MTITDILVEWDELTTERRLEAFNNLTQYVKKDIELNGVLHQEDFILEILTIAAALDEDDYFGTEGLKL